MTKKESTKIDSRRNVYTVIERIRIKDTDGNVVAIALFDYIPSQIDDAMAELEQIIASGNLVDGKYIRIEKIEK
jgi:hypothetical protein